jgi:hypothetical protein
MPDEVPFPSPDQVENKNLRPDDGKLDAERHANILEELGFGRRPQARREVQAPLTPLSAFEQMAAANLSVGELVKAGVIQDKTPNKDGEKEAERRPEDVKKITIRNSSDRKPGDPPANFRIKEDGSIEMLKNPDLKDGTTDQGELIIEVDTSAANAARAMNEQQKAAARQMIGYITERYAQAGLPADIPPSLIAALNSEPMIPAPEVRTRSPGYNGHTISSGGGGGGGISSIPQAPAGGFPPASVGRSPAMDAAESRVFNNMQPSNNIPDRAALGTFIDRVVAAIGKNEGSFTSINWNDNGAGISVGKAQFNQKSGELPTFLKNMHDADPGKFDAIFGPHAKNMLNENFVRNANITKGSDLGDRMGAALAEPKFQEVQTEMLRDKVVRAFELSSKYGHTSELFVAQVADMANQFGWGGVESCLRKGNVANIKGEESAIASLTQAGQDRYSGRAGRDSRLAQMFSSNTQANA